jgi:hypothetical protein
MIRYRLVLVGEPPITDRSGYLFCTKQDGARASAKTLLESHPAYAAVRIYDGDRLVGEIARDRPFADAAE